MKRALLALGLATGCGYGFAARRDALPTHGERVFAPEFVNSTSEADLGALFTDDFRQQLANAHVDGSSDAKVVAKGEITNIGGGPGLPLTQNNGAVVGLASYRVDARACIRLVQGPATLASTCVSGTEEYPPGIDALQIEAGRRLALRRLADRLMKEAFDRLATGF